MNEDEARRFNQMDSGRSQRIKIHIMLPERIAEIRNLINDRLRKADGYLNDTRTGKKLLSETKTEAELPGFEGNKMKFGEFQEQEYVVMMTDIRRSTDIINSNAGTEKMFKIFYVYSAVIANIVDKYSGTSTEFLGDGVLNLFPVDADLEDKLRKSFCAASDILYSTQNMMNPVFRDNGLPEIKIGLGIDYGDTIVTRFGYKGDNDLKAFGKCVYNVAKLSKGVNQIIVSPSAERAWPAAVGGSLLFNQVNINGIDGFETTRK